MLGDERCVPSTREIRIGTNPLGLECTIKLWGTNTIIAGGWESGVNNLADHLIAEAMQIPEEERYIAAIDLRDGIRLGRWRKHLDALATGLPDADKLLANIQAELDRRRAKLLSTPEERRSASLSPDDGHRLIILVVDEVETLVDRVSVGAVRPAEEDELGKSVESRFLDVLADAKPLGATVLATTHYPGLSGETQRGIFSYTNRLCGRVPTGMKESAGKILRCDAYDELGLDATLIEGNWFLLATEDPDSRGDVALSPVIADYEDDGKDLLRTFQSIGEKKSRDAAAWLLAVPGAEESIPAEWSGGRE